MRETKVAELHFASSPAVFIISHILLRLRIEMFMLYESCCYAAVLVQGEEGTNERAD
jgi:hypothetical protein